MHSLPVIRMTIWPLALTMRRPVEHATAQRSVSHTILVSVELLNGSIGFGETLPRPYVTGETDTTVLNLLKGEMTKQLLALRPDSFTDALEQVDALPFLDEQGHPCSAARAGVELALIDAYMHAFGRTVDDLTGWLGLPGFGCPGSAATARYSLVLAARTCDRLRRQVRLARACGIRDFKLKVGFDDDDARVACVAGLLERGLRRGKLALRLDANGVWELPQAIERLRAWRQWPIAGIEQPLARGAEEDLVPLREQTGQRVIHDESLITRDDAERLCALRVADAFNIRISKCGGLMPAMRLAGYARANQVDVVLGCMVGESSLLSAAGVQFLRHVPGVRHAEGSFGNLQLRDDVIRRAVRFGYGGRLPGVSDDGLGIVPDEAHLRRHSLHEPVVIEL